MDVRVLCSHGNDAGECQRVHVGQLVKIESRYLDGKGDVLGRVQAVLGPTSESIMVKLDEPYELAEGFHTEELMVSESELEVLE